MNSFDRQFQKGSTFMVVLGTALTIFFAAQTIIDPARRYLSLFLTLSGLMLTWQQYSRWTQLRKQRGIELIGTDQPDRRQ